MEKATSIVAVQLVVLGPTGLLCAQSRKARGSVSGASRGSRSRGKLWLTALGCLLLAFPVEARQEDVEAKPQSAQIWGNVILDFPRGDRLLYELDFEPKSQYAGSETWRNIDLTPLAEYYPNRWVDLTAEATLGRTKQSSEVTTFEVTPRLGVRFHFISNFRRLKGPHPLGRVSFANLARIEWRNFWYSNDSDSSHEARFRNRLELLIGLNHAEVSLDGTLYLLADFELFYPLGDEIPERFATKRRMRVGLGYRWNDRWRVEGLFIRDGVRETDEGEYDTAANIVDVRVKILFP